jgi:hypothetical protein
MHRLPGVPARSLLLALATLLLPYAVHGGERPREKPYALIFGTVWDPDGHPLFGVKVKIRRADGKKGQWELYSNHAGEFAQRVPAGAADYLVVADVKGYNLPSGKHLHPGPDVTVHIEQEERADIGLHLTW